MTSDVTTDGLKIAGVYRIPKRGPALLVLEGVPPPAKDMPALVELLRERNPEVIAMVADKGITISLLGEEQIICLFRGLAERLPPEALRRAGFTRLS